MMRRSRTATRRSAAAGAAAALAVTLGACGGSSDDGQFRTTSDTAPVFCLEHQPDEPGRAYTAGVAADTAAIFAMLRYYTTNKSVTRYCDGRSPSGIDRQWARLYVELGAEERNVAHILGWSS